MRALMIPLVLAAGCGFGFADDTSGGNTGLPTSGAGPFERPPSDPDTPAEEPWLLSMRILDLTQPAIIGRDGGGFVFFFGREPADLPAGDTQIWRGAVPDPHQLPDEVPAPVVVADQPWEEGHVGAPAIVELADRLVMFYEGGLATPQVGRAESTDGGRTWQKAAAPILADARAPGAAFDGTRWLLAFSRPGLSGIWLARSGDGASFVADETPVLEATGVDRSFEQVEVADPALAWVVESSDRGHWALWYGGLEELPDEGDAPRYAVGYAASFDGMAWNRLAGGRPVLAAPAGAPSVLVEGPTATLLYQANDGLRPALGIALHP
jgi:hypothetical protein